MAFRKLPNTKPNCLLGPLKCWVKPYSPGDTEGHDRVDRADRAAGRPAGRAAGERAGLVDFNNYKTFNRLQESLGSTLYTKPQQEDSFKQNSGLQAF